MQKKTRVPTDRPTGFPLNIFKLLALVNHWILSSYAGGQENGVAVRQGNRGWPVAQGERGAVA